MDLIARRYYLIIFLLVFLLKKSNKFINLWFIKIEADLYLILLKYSSNLLR